MCSAGLSQWAGKVSTAHSILLHLMSDSAGPPNGIEPSAEFCSCFLRQQRSKDISILRWQSPVTHSASIKYLFYIPRWHCSNGPTKLWEWTATLEQKIVLTFWYWDYERLCLCKFLLIKKPNLKIYFRWSISMLKVLLSHIPKKFAVFLKTTFWYFWVIKTLPWG